MALISVSNEYRRVIRETRKKLGLSQCALEKACRLGKTYVWYVESGKTQNTDPTQLTRLLKALHRQAERAKAPAQLKASLLKVLNAVEKHKKDESESPRLPLATVRARYGALVNKKFLDRLTDAERAELSSLEEILDEAEAEFYQPIIDRLSQLRDSLN